MRKQYPESKERWNKANPEKVRASVMRYYRKNRERILQVQKEWRRKNSGYPRKYYEEHPERWDGGATEATLKKVLNINFLQFGLTCCENCHTAIWDSYEIDHIIPVVLGGNGDYENLQILCKPCNREKFANAIDFRQHL